MVADIPGIIEGAHEGKGLGHQFLRHIERTRVLLFMIPVDSPDPSAEYDRLRSELARYSPDLDAVPFAVALTKMDLLPPRTEPPAPDVPGSIGTFPISSVARTGIDALLEALWDASRTMAAREHERTDEEEWWSP